MARRANASAAVASDAFGGYYLTGSSTDSVGRMRVETRRLTATAGGGFWISEMLPYQTSPNQPSAIAVRGSTVVVAGSVETGTAADADQFLFTYVY